MQAIEPKPKLQLTSRTMLIPFDDPTKKCNFIKLVFSVEVGMKDAEWCKWFDTFVKSGCMTLAVNKPQIFQAKEDHDWSRPTLMEWTTIHLSNQRAEKLPKMGIP